MTDVEQAIMALKEYDERKRREAEAMLSGMPVVTRYVEANADLWERRRGSAALDQGR